MPNHPSGQPPPGPVAEHPLVVPPRPPPAVVVELARTARVPLGHGGSRSLEHLETRVLAGIAKRAELNGGCTITLDLDDIAEMADPRLTSHTAYKVLHVLVVAGVLRITSQVRDSFGIALTDPPDSRRS